MTRRTTSHKCILRLLLTLALLLMSAVAVGAKPYIIVIDAGHGGKDIGAPGKEINEKVINLGVALKLGKLIEENMKDVRVVYTRHNDTFITLQQRADIANKARGDLFISIHTNSLDASSPSAPTVKGTSVYTLGTNGAKQNLDVAMRENSVMKLENDYSEKYEGFDPSSDESYIIFELGQNKHMAQSLKIADAVQRNLVSKAGRIDRGVRQSNFWVLHATAMPSILVELDFICNPTQERYLASEKGQKELANAIFTGIKEYRADAKTTPSEKSSVTTTTSTPRSQKKSGSKPKEEKPAPAVSPKGTTYRIQFLISQRKIPAGSPKFKGVKGAESYSDGGIIK
ncbi:MAG: N-acetylmuramoyl-L-alanine amidase, partial [Muribaculaceae bacterium]|nr:N-acetylmuramoyl-L-alanine amidase [Muribaculaceae bacterium]